MTNFTASEGFEAPPKKTFDIGTIPSKGQADISQVGAMIDNLRKEHFKLGNQSGLMSRTSSTIGGGAAKTQYPSKAPWAHLRTNYALG